MDSPYRYQPLSKGEVRIMVLLRGRRETALDCKMSCVRLKSFSAEEKWVPKFKVLFLSGKNDMPRSYEALSYVWGSLSASEYVLCDGRAIKITPNLRDALRMLRLVDRERVLWVDQICINQSDTAERSSQVALMGEIYKSAKQVVAWLGPDPNGMGNEVHSMLDSIAQGKLGSLKRTYIPDNVLLREIGLPEIDHAAWKALDCLITIPYFRRTWILQEVLLARSVLFVWGERQFPHEYLISLGRWLCDNPTLWSGPAPLLSPTGVDCVTTMRVDPEGLFEELLLHALTRARTDPRDLVYSILGLVKSGPRIVPDYGKTVLEVFRHATLQTILHRRNLDILSTVDHDARDADLKPSEWPTWVPLWTERPPVLIGHHYRTFCASKPDKFHEPVLLADSRTLRIEGRHVASIASVVSLEQSYIERQHIQQGAGHVTEQIWTAWRAASESTAAKEKYPELINAFILTLLCGFPDGWSPRFEPGELFYEGFAACWTSRLLGYLMSEEDFLYDPVEYVSERILVARLARQAALRRGLRFSGDLSTVDEMKLTLLDEHLTQKYGGPVADQIAALVRDFYSESKSQAFSTMWVLAGGGRDFFVLGNGLIGIGPTRILRKGDLVAVLSGGRVPHALRGSGSRSTARPIEEEGEEEGEDTFLFLGECFVQGIMFGHEEQEHERDNKRIFKLV